MFRTLLLPLLAATALLTPLPTKGQSGGNLPEVLQAKRYTIVEEFTGTACGNCPRGWLGMQQVKEKASDIAGVIAIHQYNADDPMYTPNYLTPSFSGAPACWLDRTIAPDPLEGNNEEGILKTLRRHVEKTPPTVALSLKAHYSADGKAVDIENTTTFFSSGAGYTIAFVLTADGLTSSENAWLQNNYFSENSTFFLDILYPGLGMEIFGKTGIYGKERVQLVYDDVLIASTWTKTAGGVTNSIGFTSDRRAGSSETTRATVAMPTKASLLSHIDTDKVNATVMVLDAQGRIANAARCHVEEATGIHSVLKPTSAATAYGIDGRANPRHGISIRNGQKTLLR